MICATAGVEHEPLYKRFALRTRTTLDLKLLRNLHDGRLMRGRAKANGSMHGGWSNTLMRLNFANDRRDNCFQIHPLPRGRVCPGSNCCER